MSPDGPDRSSEVSPETEPAGGARPKLLVIDASYTFEIIKARSLEDSVTCRDLDGFFSHVWTVHPFATLLTSEEWTARYGRPVHHRLGERHTFIEGKVGRFAWLGRAFIPNFLIGQIALFLSLRRLIRREGIAVIRAGDPLYIGLFSWALARLCGIPFAIRVGGNHDKVFETTGRPILPRLMFNRRIEKAVERFVFKRADLVAGANQDNLDFALANGARPQFSTLFRYGNLVDKRHLSEPTGRAIDSALLRELGLDKGQFLLYVGRLEPVKHPDDVVRVLADARARGHDVKAVLAGDGSMRSALLDLAGELGVADHLVLAGNRNQEWLAQMIPAAALIVSPHTGRALSEAAFGAAPIVAYDVDWQGELIETGATGELVPFGDWRRMAESADRFLRDRDQAAAIGRRARERALEILAPDKLNQHEREQYGALLNRKGRASTGRPTGAAGPPA